jgi:hypothetical protein
LFRATTALLSVVPAEAKVTAFPTEAGPLMSTASSENASLGVEEGMGFTKLS